MRRVVASTTFTLVTLALFATLGFLGSVAKSVAEDGSESNLRTCGGQPFPLSVFDQPAGYQNEKTGLAASLRYEISIDRSMPRRGWRVISRGENWAELIAGKPKRSGNVWLQFRRNNAGKWRVDQGWFGCWFEPVRTGASAGEWYPGKGQKVTPKTTSIQVDVYEMECNSGRPATGRVMAPQIKYRPRWIIVTYFVRWKKGSTFETCPTNPPVKKTLKLDEALGNRTILDGGFYPYPRRVPAGKHSPLG